jgi:hypothetical protein
VLFIALREDGRLLGSDARVERRNAQVTEQVDGEIVRITNYNDIDQAPAAAERLAEGRA